MADMAKMDDWLGEIPSPQTRKNYRNGIKKFEEWYRKPVESLLEFSDEECGHIVVKFYTFLKQTHPQNTCRNQTNTVIQFCKHFDKNPKYKKSLGIFTTTLTTRDHLLTVDECREMWKVASLGEKVMIKTWLLGLRIGDCTKLNWQDLNFKPSDSDEPKEILVCTNKEGITAHAFIDAEFQQLLVKHIPNLNQNSPYLFQSEKGGNLKEKQLLRRLQNLRKRAGVDARGRVFGWHIGRKLFLRTCAELGVISWNAQLMCGKAVDKSIATYINGVQLKNDAKKVHNVLKMEGKSKDDGRRIENLESAIKHVEAENMTLKTRQDELQKRFMQLKKDVITANRQKIEEAVGTEVLERALGKQRLEKMRRADDYP
jgi:integrase